MSLVRTLNPTQAEALAASQIGPAIALLNATIPQSNIRLDVALVPNSFTGNEQIAEGNFVDKDQNLIQLVDGAENGENLPLQPLLVKARNVDVILALDAVRLCAFSLMKVLIHAFRAAILMTTSQLAELWW